MASLIYAVGVIGTVLSLLVFASPMKTFRRVVKNKSTENYKGAPYIATFLCTSLWTFYGILKPCGFLVAMVNGAGAIFHCTYILLFLIYSPQDKKVKTTQLVGILDVGFVAAVISVTLFLHGTVQLTFLGTLCSGLTITMYASPLLAMKMVIKTKSVEYMPFLDTLFIFLNAGVWTLYCFLIKDLFILIPNLIGLVLGLAQVTVYVIYKKKPISSNGPTVTLGLVEAEMVNVIEMETLDYNKEAKLKDGAMQVVKKALKRVKSLPGPMLNHRDTIRKLLKTLSFEPNNLSSTAWTNLQHEDDVDVEIGIDIDKYLNPSSTLSYNLHTSYLTSND